MKRLLFIILLFCSFKGLAQFPGTDSLRNYNNRWITNSAIQAFTNYRLNTLLHGMIDWIDSARAGEGGTIGVDSIGLLNDSTLRYRKNGVFQSVVIKGGAVYHDFGFTGKGIQSDQLKIDTSLLKTVSDAQRVTDSLVALLALKLNISDTASMLSPYLRKADTASLSNRIDFKLDSAHIYTASDPDPDTLYTYKNGDSTLVGYIPKGGGGTPGGTDTQVQFNDGGSFGGDDGFTFNKTTNAVYGDSIRSIRNQSDTFYTNLQNYSADSIYFFGDSYTSGTGASPTTKRWSTYVAGWLNLVENNKGVSGSTLMKQTPVDPYGSENLIDRLDEIPTYGALKKWIVIAYGFNDMGVNNANYTPANFRTDYQIVMDTILARGWLGNQIIIVSPWYGSTATYSAYATATGTPANDRTRHLEFIDTAEAVAAANGSLFVNAFNAELANDSSLLLTTDNVHPINDGHRIIAQAVYSAITDSVFKNNQTLAVNGKISLQDVYFKNEDTLDYDAPVLGISTDGRIGTFNSHKIARTTPLGYNLPGNIGVKGKLLAGGVTAANSTKEAQVLVNGGTQATWLRAAGGLPSLITDSSVEMGMVSSTLGYIGAYNRRTSTALNMSINGLGTGASTIITFGTTAINGTNKFQFHNGPAHFNGNGVFFGGTTTPTARVHITVGSTTIAPLKFTSGTNLTTPQAGAMEFDGTDMFFTPSATRLRYALLNNTTPAAGTIIQGDGTYFTTLSLGTANQLLRVNAGATALEYFTPTFATNNLYTANGSITGSNRTVTLGALDLTFDATDEGHFHLQLPSSATGDMYYQAPITGNVTRLGAGADSTVITYASGVPVNGMVVTAGSYYPTLGNIGNVTSSTVYECYYQRIGNIVKVEGTVGIDPTSALTTTNLTISLPYASDLTATVSDLTGHIFTNASGDQTYGAIGPSAGSDVADCSFVAGAAASDTIYRFWFSYRIK